MDDTSSLNKEKQDQKIPARSKKTKDRLSSALKENITRRKLASTIKSK